MMDLSKLVDTLNKIPNFIVSKDKKNILIEKSKILNELNLFICEKYNIDSAGAEYKFREFLSNKAEETNIETSIKTIIGWAGEFSRNEQFPKADEFESSLKSVVDILGPLVNIRKSP